MCSTIIGKIVRISKNDWFTQISVLAAIITIGKQKTKPTPHKIKVQITKIEKHLNWQWGWRYEWIQI